MNILPFTLPNPLSLPSPVVSRVRRSRLGEVQDQGASDTGDAILQELRLAVVRAVDLSRCWTRLSDVVFSFANGTEVSSGPELVGSM